MSNTVRCIEATLLKMSRGHLHFELGQLQGLIQAITAERNLSKDQEGLCQEVFTRLGYLRQMVDDREQDNADDRQSLRFRSRCDPGGPAHKRRSARQRAAGSLPRGTDALTSEDARLIMWETHDMYFEMHPRAKTYRNDALFKLLPILLPQEEDHDKLYAALGVETCVECVTEAGINLETFCPWCAACALVLETEENEAGTTSGPTT